jgi:PAS domain S-box-containing protein
MVDKMPDTKLLVVEDESIVAMDIKHRAEGLGYSVMSIASSGEEAIEKTKKYKPDLVLMDIVLKGKMDGVEAAQVIREECDIPIVYLTAYSDEKTLGRAKLTGPFGYIIKPFEDRELHSAVEVALYKHQMDSKLRESEEKYRNLFESFPDPILLLDFKGNIVFMNQTLEKIIGIRRKKIIGKSILNLAKMGFFIDDEINNYLDSIPSIIENKETDPFEMNLIDKNGQELYFEIYSSILSSEEHGSIIQFIGHDITSRVEAEEQRGELIREKARVELYGFVVSAVPVFASSIPPQLRNTIIKNFADRFEKNVRPNFNKEMSANGFLDIIKEPDSEHSAEIFNVYLSWISELLSNLGIKTRVFRDEPKIKLEFITFPWIDEARKNPIFTLIFRAMIIRSFTWTGLKGTVTQTSSLLEGSKNIKFEFYLPK